jgi:hypothetical protein
MRKTQNNTGKVVAANFQIGLYVSETLNRFDHVHFLIFCLAQRNENHQNVI